MQENISCCGVDCGACRFYPNDCAGCAAIEGRAFWLQFTGGDVCDIYDCCVVQKQYAHCGQCAQLACDRYNQKDPTQSDEENEATFQRQLKTLRRLAAKEAEVPRRKTDPGVQK